MELRGFWCGTESAGTEEFLVGNRGVFMCGTEGSLVWNKGS